jgi:hypothetical protein
MTAPPPEHGDAVEPRIGSTAMDNAPKMRSQVNVSAL